MKYKIISVAAFVLPCVAFSQPSVTSNVPKIGLASKNGEHRLVQKGVSTFKTVFYFPTTNSYIECRTKVISSLQSDERLLGKVAPCDAISNPHAAIDFYDIRSGDSLAFKLKGTAYSKEFKGFILESFGGQKFLISDSFIQGDVQIKALFSKPIPREGYQLVLKPPKNGTQLREN